MDVGQKIRDHYLKSLEHCRKDIHGTDAERLRERTAQLAAWSEVTMGIAIALLGRVENLEADLREKSKQISMLTTKIEREIPQRIDKMTAEVTTAALAGRESNN